MIEVKKNDGVLPEEQKIHLRNGIKSGSIAYVARGDRALPKLIDKLVKRGIL